MNADKFKNLPAFTGVTIKHWPNTNKFVWRGQTLEIDKLTKDEVETLAKDKAFPHWTMPEAKTATDSGNPKAPANQPA